MREARVAGVLLGLAAGDQIGGPVRMALRLGQSLVHCGGFSQDDLMGRYLDWWRTDAFDMGPTAARVFLRVERGCTWEEAARQVDAEAGGLTAGCNPAHRSAPLAMCTTIPTEALADLARREARVTHCHPLAGDVAAAVVRLCRALIEGADWELACEQAARGRLPETRQVLEGTSVAPLSPGGFAPEVLRAAVAFVSAADSAEEALHHSLAFAGPANYCPVLVGSLAGARWGVNAIPSSLLAHHTALLPLLQQTAQALALGWQDSVLTV
ncbi:ADP-ribosylglycohydrolase family protein [Armatimonas rosea]|uniref:ADP-ribosylglycohydrolase n=1 Tax=Armatimonas rosea TaxID=685828 RepID=A0A7W9SMX6_ARMRO|nr:ADP-ribosylglycohydrolase family protein [Armatimonas rosea]MBB6048908.1 ADP-ribosylglycohydrolase [Armatimonas rosea]